MKKLTNAITHSYQMRIEKTNFSKVTVNLYKTNSLVSTLINRSSTAEGVASKLKTLANRSVNISQDVQELNNTYQEDLKDIHVENVKLRETMSRLTDLFEKQRR